MPFTPNSELDLLFDDKLVPKTAFDALAERGLHVSESGEGECYVVLLLESATFWSQLFLMNNMSLVADIRFLSLMYIHSFVH